MQEEKYGKNRIYQNYLFIFSIHTVVLKCIIFLIFLKGMSKHLRKKNIQHFLIFKRGAWNVLQKMAHKHLIFRVLMKSKYFLKCLSSQFIHLNECYTYLIQTSKWKFPLIAYSIMTALYKSTGPCGHISMCFRSQPMCYNATGCSTSNTKYCRLVLQLTIIEIIQNYTTCGR